MKLTAGLRSTLRNVADGTPLPRRIKTLLYMGSLADRGLISAETLPGSDPAFVRWVITPAGRAALEGAVR